MPPGAASEAVPISHPETFRWTTLPKGTPFLATLSDFVLIPAPLTPGRPRVRHQVLWARVDGRGGVTICCKMVGGCEMTQSLISLATSMVS